MLFPCQGEGSALQFTQIAPPVHFSQQKTSNLKEFVPSFLLPSSSSLSGTVTGKQNEFMPVPSLSTNPLQSFLEIPTSTPANIRHSLVPLSLPHSFKQSSPNRQGVHRQHQNELSSVRLANLPQTDFASKLPSKQRIHEKSGETSFKPILINITPNNINQILDRGSFHAIDSNNKQSSSTNNNNNNSNNNFLKIETDNSNQILIDDSYTANDIATNEEPKINAMKTKAIQTMLGLPNFGYYFL